MSSYTSPRNWRVGDEVTSALLNGISQQIGQLQTYVITGTTNVTMSSGVGTVTHGAGYVPSVVMVTPLLGTIFVGVGVKAGSITSTTFQIVAFNGFANANYFTGASLTVYWLVAK